jgi:type III secretory pathway component EscV
VFGPLNGPRVALVCFAVVAALAGLIAGYPVVTVVLLAGVAVHGLGWLYLYRQHMRRSTR